MADKRATEAQRRVRSRESARHNPPHGKPRRTPIKGKRLSREPESIGFHRKGRSINRSVTIVAFIFFAFVLVYILQSFYFILTKPAITTEVIRTGSVESPRTVTGVIIRDEFVYFAEREGQLAFNVNDYERVKSGTTVVNIQNVDAVRDINRNMATIEEQIMELQALRQNTSSIDPNIQRVNGQIKNIIDSRLHHFTAFTVPEVYTLKDSLNQIITTRNRMVLDYNQHVREDLDLQQQQLLNQLGMHTTPVRAEQGGIMSPVIDGLEEVLTLQNMRDLNREETFFNPDYDKIIPAREVSPGDPVFKIIASNIWYIAAYFPNNTVEGFEENQVRTFYIEKNGEFLPVSMRIDRLDRDFNNSFLLLRCTKNMIDFLNTRSVSLRTSDNVRTGLKISNTAIVTRDFFAIPHEYIFESDRGRYVMVYLGETQVNVPVSVVESDERFSYVPLETDNLRLGDEVLNARHNNDKIELTEIVTLQGVYRVNNGFADFIKIIPDEESGSGGFTILNPALNPRFKEYDHIVTNGQDIKDGQII
jgi:hypothetical protein